MLMLNQAVSPGTRLTVEPGDTLKLVMPSGKVVTITVDPDTKGGPIGFDTTLKPNGDLDIVLD